jgi:putative endonuclease
MGEYKHFVYVLKSERDGKLYTGRTSWLERRLKQHEDGLVKSTKNRRPLKLVYKEEFDNIEQAIAREKFFKSGQGRSFLSEKIRT